ncbi:MAG TPA: aspartate kinase [Candidatus Limnocylindrales bacterium]|nr:aspartate kinase [Candidatus Limnocylindrales bacterium]
MKVLKFGGTSVGSADAIAKVAEIVKATPGGKVLVVSATSGTTNALVEAARTAEGGDAAGADRELEALAKTHRDLLADVAGSGPAAKAALDDIAALTERTGSLLRSVAILRECTRRSLDAILSYGERVSAPIVAAALASRGIDAEAVSAEGLVVTDDAFGAANPLLDETRSRVAKDLVPRTEHGKTPVVTGFIGSTADGITTTLGRGASDYSAAIIAACLGATELLIYTDVSGVMSADPRIVAGARPLESLSYAEAAELSYFGARVLHPRSVLPAIEAGIPVRIANTFAPEQPGTTITARSTPDGSVVKATTSLGGLGLITVQGAGMSGVPGFAAKVFDTTAAEGVSVLMISQSSSENSICLVVPADTAERLRAALQRMLAKEISHHDVERVTVEAPMAVVAAVGEGMRGTPGVAGRLFGALGRAGVNVVAIAQGSSELNVSLCVAEGEREKAVRAIHEEFHR